MNYNPQSPKNPIAAKNFHTRRVLLNTSKEAFIGVGAAIEEMRVDNPGAVVYRDIAAAIAEFRLGIAGQQRDDYMAGVGYIMGTYGGPPSLPVETFNLQIRLLAHDGVTRIAEGEGGVIVFGSTYLCDSEGEIHFSNLDSTYLGIHDIDFITGDLIYHPTYFELDGTNVNLVYVFREELAAPTTVPEHEATAQDGNGDTWVLTFAENMAERYSLIDLTEAPAIDIDGTPATIDSVVIDDNVITVTIDGTWGFNSSVACAFNPYYVKSITNKLVKDPIIAEFATGPA